MLLRSLCSGLLVQSLGFVDDVLHQVQFCASVHRPVGMKLPHPFPLDRLAGFSDLALVADDGSTQLTRISLSRAICLDQEVATSLRWDPVVDCLGLLLHWQHLEILWHRRGRRRGCCTRWIFTFSSASSVCGTAGKWRSRHSCSFEATGFRGGGNMATAFRVK